MFGIRLFKTAALYVCILILSCILLTACRKDPPLSPEEREQIIQQIRDYSFTYWPLPGHAETITFEVDKISEKKLDELCINIKKYGIEYLDDLLREQHESIRKAEEREKSNSEDR